MLQYNLMGAVCQDAIVLAWVKAETVEVREG
jgi:hypothetical protein